MSNEARTQTEDPYLALQSTSEFQALRKKFRGFVFPMTAFFLAWYFLYVLLSMFAPDFMGQEVGAPGITVGLLFGLGQFVTTFAITIIYARWANRELDPMAEAAAAQMTAARRRLEGELTMALTLPFAEATSVGSPALNIAIFAAFVVVTLAIVIRVSSGKKTAEQYYTAAGAFSGRQNGVAIAGDYLSAASFLGIAGAIALQGYDGFLYSIGFLVAWLVALLLVAELMRNTGRFTMADVLSYRLRQRPVRIATAISVHHASRSSTCWPRWPAPAAWSRCSSASRARRPRTWSSPSSAAS